MTPPTPSGGGVPFDGGARRTYGFKLGDERAIARSTRGTEILVEGRSGRQPTDSDGYPSNTSISMRAKNTKP